ncbi:hypothetical protein HYH03_002559 [Edaphochlamys debaryana]|uniref:Uncharacterized protein n=1 Tax=Edaphochlamys debaryana TaxID=47281 RepID=A0A835YAY7_9CHLO|nr:hypothetical protein HYH03_002559 [Edaphochlamys debaryana]|eukprot:KAG2499620.1 hypothetical protein HYH03_002559 [Edaphochlamys debaryana]
MAWDVARGGPPDVDKQGGRRNSQDSSPHDDRETGRSSDPLGVKQGNVREPLLSILRHALFPGATVDFEESERVRAFDSGAGASAPTPPGRLATVSSGVEAPTSPVPTETARQRPRVSIGASTDGSSPGASGSGAATGPSAAVTVVRRGSATGGPGPAAPQSSLSAAWTRATGASASGMQQPALRVAPSVYGAPPDASRRSSAAAGGLGPGPLVMEQSEYAADEAPCVQWVIRPSPPIESAYQLGEVLGRGSFGTVRIATQLASGARVAVKTITKSLLRPADIAALRREVEILHHLSGHPHVSQLLGVFEEPSQLHLCLELYQGGDLFDEIIAIGRHSERASADVMRTVLAAIAYCHEMGVAHRDIKPENFMLTATGAAADDPDADGRMSGYSERTSQNSSRGAVGARLKLIDFGLSIFCNDDTPMTDTVGTSYYVAPEVLSGAYTRAIDVWSAGIILHIMLCGYAPFDGPNDELILRAIMTQELDLKTDPVWQSISPEALAVLRAMLERDPAKRATADQLLAMPWLGRTEAQCTAPSAPLPGVVSERMRRFARMNSFKKEARRVMAGLLRREEVAGLVAQFRALDADGDGRIDIQELKDGLARQELRLRGPGAGPGHMTEEQLQELLERADCNGDGMLDESEFLGAALPDATIRRHSQLAARPPLPAHAHASASASGVDPRGASARSRAGPSRPFSAGANPLAAAFAHFDVDGSGFITQDELRAALSAHHPSGKGPDIAALMARFDRNGDGCVDYDEFVAMMVEDIEASSGSDGEFDHRHRSGRRASVPAGHAPVKGQEERQEGRPKPQAPPVPPRQPSLLPSPRQRQEAAEAAAASASASASGVNRGASGAVSRAGSRMVGGPQPPSGPPQLPPGSARGGHTEPLPLLPAHMAAAGVAAAERPMRSRHSTAPGGGANDGDVSEDERPYDNGAVGAHGEHVPPRSRGSAAWGGDMRLGPGPHRPVRGDSAASVRSRGSTAVVQPYGYSGRGSPLDWCDECEEGAASPASGSRGGNRSRGRAARAHRSGADGSGGGGDTGGDAMAVAGAAASAAVAARLGASAVAAASGIRRGDTAARSGAGAAAAFVSAAAAGAAAQAAALLAPAATASGPSAPQRPQEDESSRRRPAASPTGRQDESRRGGAPGSHGHSRLRPESPARDSEGMACSTSQPLPARVSHTTKPAKPSTSTAGGGAGDGGGGSTRSHPLMLLSDASGSSSPRSPAGAARSPAAAAGSQRSPPPALSLPPQPAADKRSRRHSAAAAAGGLLAAEDYPSDLDSSACSSPNPAAMLEGRAPNASLQLDGRGPIFPVPPAAAVSHGFGSHLPGSGSRDSIASGGVDAASSTAVRPQQSYGRRQPPALQLQQMYGNPSGGAVAGANGDRDRDRESYAGDGGDRKSCPEVQARAAAAALGTWAPPSPPMATARAAGTSDTPGLGLGVLASSASATTSAAAATAAARAREGSRGNRSPAAWSSQPLPQPIQLGLPHAPSAYPAHQHPLSPRVTPPAAAPPASPAAARRQRQRRSLGAVGDDGELLDVSPRGPSVGGAAGMAVGAGVGLTDLNTFVKPSITRSLVIEEPEAAGVLPGAPAEGEAGAAYAAAPRQTGSFWQVPR